MIVRSVLALLATLVALAGCSTGTDAVVRGGEFEFVSPGGQTKIFYDPPESRGTVGGLQRVADTTAGDGAVVLGINVRDNREAAADFVRDRELTWQSIYDPPGRSLLALHGYPRNVVPSTIVLDRRPRVAAVFLQALLTDDLLPVVRRVATET